ncbi:hypothetical protein OC834_006963 [Tilletia horrida]|nr:hypothetical protein OC834_006963 [Tilletia horrida]
MKVFSQWASLRGGLVALAALTVAAEAGSIHWNPFPDSLLSLIPRAGGRQRPGRSCSSSSDCAVTSCFKDPSCTGSCPGLCGLIPLGGSSCAADNECAQGQCIGGVCSLIADGGACTLSGQCTSGICNINGRCVTPSTGSQRGGDVCSSNSQCSGGMCSDSGTPLCRNAGQICESVSLCAAQSIGGTCSASGDCAAGDCVSGKCAYRSIGSTCAFNSQCATGLCRYGLCSQLNAGDACNLDGPDDSCVTAFCIRNSCLPTSTGYCTLRFGMCKWSLPKSGLRC